MEVKKIAKNNIGVVFSLKDEFSGEVGNIVKNAKAAEGAVSKSAKSIQDLGAAAGKAGKKMTARLTLPIVGMGTVAMKTVSSFDDGMANVQKISGATGKEFDDLRAKAQELGATTAFSASEASDGMGILAASGMETNDILATSEDMFNLMSAGSVNAETAASVLTNTMAQFNMSASSSEKIVDTFAAGSSKAKVSVEELEHAMALSGGSMSSMNMSVTGAVAAIGQLANAGVPAAQTGAALNAMSREVKANSKEFKKLGVDVYDPVTGDLKEMGMVMEELEVLLDGKSDAERDAALQTVFSGQAMQGATAWLNEGSEAYSQLASDIFEAEGASKTMAAIQEDTVGGAFRGVKSAMEGMMIEIGDVIKEPVQKIALYIQDLALKFGGLSEPAKKMIIGAALVVAAIGPLLLVFAKIVSVVTTLAPVIGALTSPMGLVVVGIVALIAVGVLLYKNWDKVKAKTQELWDKFKDTKAFDVLNGALETLKGGLEKVGDFFQGVKDKFDSFKNAIGKFKVPKWVSTIGGKLSGASRAASNGAEESYAVGTNKVPRDMLANIHKGEMIIPARQSQNLREQGVSLNNIDKGGLNKPVQTTKVVSNGSGSNVTIAKLADQIIIREEADIDKLAKALVRNIKRTQLNMA